jgi:hypothetical protein
MGVTAAAVFGDSFVALRVLAGEILGLAVAVLAVASFMRSEGNCSGKLSVNPLRCVSSLITPTGQ